MSGHPWLMERFRALFGRERMDAEMDEELRFHLEMEVEKNLRAGLPPSQARRQALIAFGGIERYREKTREERWGRSLGDLARDIRFAFRSLRKSPGFSLIAIASLALGIGANTAIFSLANAMLFRKSPFSAPEGLVSIYRDRAQGDFDAMSYPDFRVIREETGGTFDQVGGFQYGLAHRETDSGSEPGPALLRPATPPGPAHEGEVKPPPGPQ